MCVYYSNDGLEIALTLSDQRGDEIAAVIGRQEGGNKEKERIATHSIVISPAAPKGFLLGSVKRWSP